MHYFFVTFTIRIASLSLVSHYLLFNLFSQLANDKIPNAGDKNCLFSVRSHFYHIFSIYFHQNNKLHFLKAEKILIDVILYEMLK